jgi:hypothetical protein
VHGVKIVEWYGMKHSVIVHGWEGYPSEAWFPFKNIDLFESRLGAKVSVLHARGHMGANDHAEVVPEILEACL